METSENGVLNRDSDLDICRRRLSSLENQFSALNITCEEMSSQMEGARVLAETMVDTARAHSIEDLCHQIGSAALTLEPNSYVAVNLYQPAEHCFRVVSIFGFDKHISSALKVLGVDLRTIRFSGDLDEDSRARYTSGHLERTKDGLYGFMSGQGPQAVCAAFASLLRIREVFHVGFAVDDVPYGGTTLMPRD
ncbi:MAG: hypothetical protein KAQ74_02920, partial [Dehalococcoidia bacterium]|nr:hypothetical protein [Dehalococcoidia bacterium]